MRGLPRLSYIGTMYIKKARLSGGLVYTKFMLNISRIESKETILMRLQHNCTKNFKNLQLGFNKLCYRVTSL